MRGIEPWAKVNWAPCRLMPTFQTSDLLHQNFSAGSNANVKDWAICWHYIPLSQSNHPQMSTNSHRDLGFFKNRFYPTILSVHQQINTDRSWRRSKRWQPWFDQNRQAISCRLWPITETQHLPTLHCISPQVKSGASQRQRKTKKVLSNVFSFLLQCDTLLVRSNKCCGSPYSTVRSVLCFRQCVSLTTIIQYGNFLVSGTQII